MTALRDRDPEVTSSELDEDVAEIEYSLDQYYGDARPTRQGTCRPGWTARCGRSSRTWAARPACRSTSPLQPAADLIRRLEPELMANVFRWTGHFPERTRVLLRYLAERAAQLEQGYPAEREDSAIMALTTLVTGLAMNHVQRGSYLP